MTENKVHPPIAYVDTETTSLSAETGKIWEFAGIRYDFLTPDVARERGPSAWVSTPFGAAFETSMVVQINQSLGEADVMSLKIGMYHERFGKNGDWNSFEITDFGNPVPIYRAKFPQKGEVAEPGEAAVMIEEFLRGTSIFGNTINFDHERLERFLRWENLCPAWHYHPVDVKTFAAGVLSAHGHDLSFPFYSSEISELMGVPQPTEGQDLHTAMGDTTWTRNLHWAALRKRVGVAD